MKRCTNVTINDIVKLNTAPFCLALLPSVKGHVFVLDFFFSSPRFSLFIKGLNPNSLELNYFGNFG